MKCAAHPEVETNLRCSKCGQAICPQCLVQTPVGARCPDCAQLYRLPTFQVSTKYILRAMGSGLGMALVGGIVWGVIISSLDLFYLNLILAVGVGYVIGEVVSLSVNRKRGTRLAIIAGLALPLSYLVSIMPPWGSFLNPFSLTYLILDLVSIAAGIFVAVSRLR